MQATIDAKPTELEAVLARFERYRQGMMREAKTTTKSRVKNLRMMGNIADEMYGLPLWELETFALEEILTSRELSTNTIIAYRQAIVELFKYCERARIIPSADPAKAMTCPRAPKPNPRPVTEEELGRLLTAACTDPKLSAMLALGAYAGMRVDEIAKCHSSDFNWDIADEPMLRITGKGSKVRHVPMHPMVAKHCAYLGIPDDGYLFPSRKTARPHITSGTVTTRITTHMRTCGIDATAHKLRHRFGTMLYRKTRDLELVSRMLGHEGIEITRAYVASATDDVHAHFAVRML